MKCLIVGLFFLLINVGCDDSCSEATDDSQTEETPVENLENLITYTASNEVFTNPERGFMHTWTVYSEGTAVDMTSLANLKSENVSLVLRLYYLNQFKESELSDTQLNLIKTDFERFREAGIKCVLRFAYTDNQNGTDAALDIIEMHLAQLKPIFTENSDVIAFVQAGFIGAWGSGTILPMV